MARLVSRSLDAYSSEQSASLLSVSNMQISSQSSTPFLSGFLSIPSDSCTNLALSLSYRSQSLVAFSD